MAEIIPFDFETNAVRVVMIDGAPWFVAADVCRVLEHTNPAVALRRLDDDERQMVNMNTLNFSYGIQEGNRGNPNAAIVSESGLYALIITSNKPAAKRFRKWVTAEVLPAIRRDGSYRLVGADHADLAEKRAFYAALPEEHRERADTRADALAQVEALIAEGSRVGAAVAAVAQEIGLSVRSLYNYRRSVYMVARGDWGAAMAPRWSAPRGMIAECHPEAMVMFARLRMSGARVTDCYRRMSDEAVLQGWSPIPSERTLRRALDRGLPKQTFNIGAA